ncbi:hypothetical protein MMC30_001530 [Trapelia coarctata]|nr:hypothetical protein [Trapelia coarctata]
MAASDSSSRYANAMEEGQIVHPVESEKQDRSDPTSPALSSSATMVPFTRSSSQVLKSVKSFPLTVRKTWTDLVAQEDRIPVTIHKLEDSPKGFPIVASYLDSDDSFMLYRRFGFLHARLLLNKQDELRELEEELRDMDNDDWEEESSRRFLQSRELDECRDLEDGRKSRQGLLEKIEKKILEYGTLLQQAQQLVALNRPADRDHRSVINFLENQKPLFKSEVSFIYEKEDLVTLRPGRETAFLDAFVERVIRICNCKPIQRIFCTEETRAKTDLPHIHYFTRGRINTFVTMIITCFILVVLVVPIWLLYHLTAASGTGATNPLCIGVLLSFTLIFSAVLSLFTKARRHEILAAAAG